MELLNIYPSCLAAIRILSRDKILLSRTITTDQFNTLLNIANIGSANANISNSQIAVESLKCLCNLVFQNTGCQMMCLKNAAIDGIFRRLRSYKCVFLFNVCRQLEFKLFPKCYAMLSFHSMLIFLGASKHYNFICFVIVVFIFQFFFQRCRYSIRIAILRHETIVFDNSAK